MNHTPGPWTMRPARASVGAHYIEGGETASKWLVAEVSGQGERNEANARLIAAAPDLLEALENFVMRYTMLVNSGDAGNWDPEDDAVVIQARFAIAKAKGEA